MSAIATGSCFARAPPRRFFLAGGPLALGFVAVVVEVEGETTGDGKVLRASHLAARAARNLGTWSSRWSVVLFLPPEGPLKKTKKQAPLKKTKKTVYTFLRWVWAVASAERHALADRTDAASKQIRPRDGDRG